MVHNDIKPDNIGLTKDLKTVKIMDFGSSRQEVSLLAASSHIAFTISYAAPETKEKLFLPASDLYSIANVIVLLFLVKENKGMPDDENVEKYPLFIKHQLLGLTTYDPANPSPGMDLFAKKLEDLKKIKGIPQHIQLVLREMLQPDHNDRIKASVALNKFMDHFKVEFEYPKLQKENKALKVQN